MMTIKHNNTFCTVLSIIIIIKLHCTSDCPASVCVCVCGVGGLKCVRVCGVVCVCVCVVGGLKCVRACVCGVVWCVCGGGGVLW